jgi:hypothetical protein
MTQYDPDRWAVIEAIIDGSVQRRIVAGWSGGYLDSDYWRISSIILTAKEFDDHYAFDNESGSHYICYKNRFGFTGLSASVFNSLKEKQPVGWKIVKEYVYTHNVTDALYDAQREFVEGTDGLGGLSEDT